MPQDALTDLLRKIAQGPPRTFVELAQALEISPDLLGMMLADLRRAGYLVTLETACEGGCAKCAQQERCGLHFAGRLWALTAKGSQRLAI
jgi:hypothetical protein